MARKKRSRVSVEEVAPAQGKKQARNQGMKPAREQQWQQRRQQQEPEKLQFADSSGDELDESLSLEDESFISQMQQRFGGATAAAAATAPGEAQAKTARHGALLKGLTAQQAAARDVDDPHGNAAKRARRHPGAAGAYAANQGLPSSGSGEETAGEGQEKLQFVDSSGDELDESLSLEDESFISQMQQRFGSGAATAEAAAAPDRAQAEAACHNSLLRSLVAEANRTSHEDGEKEPSDGEEEQEEQPEGQKVDKNALAKAAAQERKKMARQKKKAKRKAKKQNLSKEGWVKKRNAWGEMQGWVKP